MADYDLIDEGLSEEQTARAEADTPCRFTTGCAGTGKTYNAVAAVKADASHGVLSSTTGISAVNLGAITINSLLKYSDTRVMRDHFINGSLQRVLHGLAKQYRWLYVDEISMYGGDALDLLYRAVVEANRYADVTEPMGIHILGDLAQLPPVKSPWVFTASCWDRFHENTERLTKVWRQAEDQIPFLLALNLTRQGQGNEAAGVLAGAGARFESALDTEFEGTTILPRNDQVSRYNQMALDRLPGKSFRVQSRRWSSKVRKDGTFILPTEWQQNPKTHEWGIPPEVELKLGAYVMLLANAPDFEYVNGDCGWIDCYRPSGPWNNYGGDVLSIKLARTGKLILLFPLVRGVEYGDRPADWRDSNHKVAKSDDDGGWLPRPHYRSRVKRYVTGQIEYFPLRLAYASTVHKTQSLTLDRVQCDIRNSFFGFPGMAYTALSRCRTLAGLRIVGQQEVLAKRIVIDERIRPWL